MAMKKHVANEHNSDLQKYFLHIFLLYNVEMVANGKNVNIR